MPPEPAPISTDGTPCCRPWPRCPSLIRTAPLRAADRDLLLAKTALLESGATPVYVELTRADLQLPLVRALVPGLPLAADVDRFARLGLRHFAAHRTAAGRGRKGFH